MEKWGEKFEKALGGNRVDFKVFSFFIWKWSCGEHCHFRFLRLLVLFKKFHDLMTLFHDDGDEGRLIIFMSEVSI